MELLAEVNQQDGITVVVTLHQVDFAIRYCRRTVALKEGCIVYDGPSDRLTPAFLREIYGASSEELFARATGMKSRPLSRVFLCAKPAMPHNQSVIKEIIA